jgi:hypothetical protein
MFLIRLILAEIMVIRVTLLEITIRAILVDITLFRLFSLMLLGIKKRKKIFFHGIQAIVHK